MIRLSKSCISAKEKAYALEVLDREYLGMGERVGAFETALANFLNRETVCVSSGTSALHLALQAVGVTQGDEVIVPSMTYLASYQAISATGGVPVSCDVDPTTLQMDFNDAERRITPKTKAIMPVYFAGDPSQQSNWMKLASKYKLRLVEDAAHAFGSKIQGQPLGSNGDVTCFSFDGIKNITSGEGGCVVSSDPAVLKIVRDARLLGVSDDSKMRYIGKRSWAPKVNMQGWRYHMNDLSAAIGIGQLERFDYLASRRQSIARLYDHRFCDLDCVKTLSSDYDNVVPHLYTIRLPNPFIRDKVKDWLHGVGVQTGLHYYPNHLLDFYKKDVPLSLPMTEEIVGEILSLPLHPDLADSDVNYVCDQVKLCLYGMKS